MMITKKFLKGLFIIYVIIYVLTEKQRKQIPEREIPGLFPLLSLYLNVIVVVSSCVLPPQRCWEENFFSQKLYLCILIFTNYS